MKRRGYILLSLLIMVAFCFVGSFKSGYHEDEIFTFGLSNHTYYDATRPTIREDKIYTGNEILNDYVSVMSNKRFDYSNVITNQKADAAHPPLYYLIIHTVSSLFPNMDIKWVGLIPNVIFAVIVFWEIVALFGLFVEKRFAIPFSLIFIFTMGFVNNVVFFRMYVLLTVWTNALFILLCKNKPEADKNVKFYLSLWAIVLGGLMTQYYFVVICVFACAIYTVSLISLKKWLELVKCGISVACAGLSGFLLYPSILHQIFFGYRGKQAFSNVKEPNYLGRIKDYLDILNLHVFGGFFLIVFLGIMFLSVYMVWRKKGIAECLQKNGRNLIQLLVPCVLYVLIVSIVAPYQIDRYVTNVMGLLYVGVFSLLFVIIQKFSRKGVIAVLLIMGIVLVGSYREGLPNLRYSEKQIVEKFEENSQTKCICFQKKYSDRWKFFNVYNELAELDSIQFVFGKITKEPEKEQNLLLNYEAEDSLIIYVDNKMNADKIIDDILNSNSNLSTSETLYDAGYGIFYYLN